MSLSEQLGLRGPKTSKPLGLTLKGKDLENLRDEQIYQLYELMVATTIKEKNEDKMNEKKKK